MSDRSIPRICVSPADAPSPFAVDAVALEDDTRLVLGSDPIVRETDTSLSELLEDAISSDPREPGTVVVLEASPLRLHVIVHDLSLEPSWNEEWVSKGLASMFAEVEARNVVSMALPVLGSLYGQLDPLRFCGLLASELGKGSFRYLERIWLVVEDSADDVRDLLTRLGCDIC